MSAAETTRALEAWRAAERRVEAAIPGTPEHEAALADVERARSRYHRSLDELREALRQVDQSRDEELSHTGWA